MRMRTSLLLWATAIVLIVGVGTTSKTTSAVQDSGGSSQRGTAGETFAPIAIEELEPCCRSRRSRRSDGPTGRVRGRVEVPRGRRVDPATYRRLKRQADFDPRVPTGSEVGLAEDPPLLPSAPRARSRFEGLDANEAGGFTPPDTIVAAGPNEVLEATNSALRLSSRANRDVEIQSLNDHFGVAPSQPRSSGSARLAGDLFDPKVYFDRLSNRFFIVALFQNERPNQSFIYLSVSRSSSVVSLEEGWCNYRILGKRRKSWADFPGFGVNGSWVAVSANNFRFSGPFFNVYLYVVDKISLVDNATSCPKLTLFVFKAPQEAAGGKAFTVQPAQHYTESNLPGDPLFFVSAVFGTSTSYGLWQLTTGNTSATAARPSLSRISLTGDLHSIPPNARQKGGGVRLDTGVDDILQAAFRDGELWATQTTGCRLGGGANESCIHVLQITPGGTSALSGTIDFQETFGRKNEYFWNPGIAVNRLGDVVVPFQRSSRRLFLSTAYNGKKARAKKMDAVVSLARGKCNLQDIDGSGLNRTGDYVGAQADPLGNLSFWIAGEFSKKIPGLSGCNWSTQIAKAKY